MHMVGIRRTLLEVHAWLAVSATTRYSYTQGLWQRKLAPEELFHPGTLETAKV